MGAVHWIRGALAFVLIVGCGGALSDVYRWTDKDGVVHFGDRLHSTDAEAVKKVTVPRPNLAEGYKPPPYQAGEPPGANALADGQTPAAPAQAAAPQPAAAPPTGRGFAEQYKNSCQARKAAFAASEACFRACGMTLGGGYMNNSGCDHCVDQPEPRC